MNILFSWLGPAMALCIRPATLVHRATLPTMTSTGQCDTSETRGMFSVAKVRDELNSGDRVDPGWYQDPKGTVAYENADQVQQPTLAPAPKALSKTINVRKPTGGRFKH
jgi:hypothetical protein